ncbi:FAD-dependent monooxygenase [Micromonospora sp. NPDC049523]|uniref:FAD-dependent monooxygenase n=1 Tax=Micromonospora sp. NPDC049523 TaxID=3155921 RepID=UPI00342A0722
MIEHDQRHPTTTETPVLVVGAGPVGLVLAQELAHHGVRCLVVDRSRSASRHPKMDYLNARSMELLRRLGLVDEIRARGVPDDHPFTFLWTTSLAEPPVSVWSYPSVAQLRKTIADDRDGVQPREPYQRIVGSRLEELGRARCRADDLVDLREGWSFEALESGPDGVDVVLVETGSGLRERVHARFVVGCDGANSAVAAAVGIEQDELGPRAHHRDVYFRSTDPVLRRHGRFFLAVAAAGLTLVARDGVGTWTATFPVADDDPVDGDPLDEVRRRLGVPLEVDEVLTVAHWEGRLAVARRYRQGPVFLAGDAAHQFFPTGGHGANTGIADAVDLGWKLAAVLDGWAGAALLDSYEAERRPVALFNREMCFNLLEVWRRYPALWAGGASRSRLAGFLDTERHQVDNIGVHLGQRYLDSPVICPDGTPEPPWDWHRAVATTWPGGRAPNVRLTDGGHLQDRLGPGFTLVDTSGRDAGGPLADEASRLGVPLTHLAVDDPGVRAVWERDLVLVRPDQHVAWRGDRAPDDWRAVLHRVTGRAGDGGRHAY